MNISANYFHCNNTKTVNCSSHARSGPCNITQFTHVHYTLKRDQPIPWRHDNTPQHWTLYHLTQGSCFQSHDPPLPTRNRSLYQLVGYLYIQTWLEVRGIANTVWHSGSNVLWLLHLYFLMYVFGNYQEILLTTRYKTKQSSKTLSTFNYFLMFLNVVFKLLFQNCGRFFLF